MIPFSTFYRQVKEISVPEGVGTNVLAAFRDYVVNGLIRTQTYIPCLRDNNVDFFVKAEAKEFCNVDIIHGPRGKIGAVYVFKPGLDCRKHFYDAVSTTQINCWIEQQKCQCDPTVPPSTNVYDSPYCNYLMDADDACAAPYVNVPEDDSVFTGCSERIYAKGPDNKLYLAPRFPCGYVVAVHSDGIKRTWRDTDALPDDEDLKHAVAAYAEAKLLEKDREFVGARSLMNTYDELMRDMAHRCREERRLPTRRDCSAAADSMLPTINPFSELNPYNATTGAQVGDPNSSCVYCP